MESISIGKRLRDIRLYRKYTQRQLATETGLSLSVIQQYEYDKRKPTDKQLEKIAEVLRVPAALLTPLDVTSLGGVDAVITEMLRASPNMTVCDNKDDITITLPKGDMSEETLDAYYRVIALLNVITPEFVESRYNYGAEVVDIGMRVPVRKWDRPEKELENIKKEIKLDSQLLVLLEAGNDLQAIDWKKLFRPSDASR